MGTKVNARLHALVGPTRLSGLRWIGALWIVALLCSTGRCAQVDKSVPTLAKVIAEANRYAGETRALEEIDGAIAHLENELSILQRVKPDRILDLQLQRDAEVGQLQDEQDEELRQLTASHAAIMEDYRNGVFCKGCDRTRTEFVGGGNSAADWPGHTASNGGTYAVSQEQIQAKQNQLDAQLQDLRNAHSTKIGKASNNWDRRIQSLTQILDDGIADKEQQIRDAYAKRRDIVIRQIDARNQTGQGTERFFDAVFSEHTQMVRERAKFDARQSNLDYQVKDLRPEFDRLQAEYEAIKQAHASKWPMAISATPPDRLAQRIADHKLGDSALARARAQGILIQQVRDQKQSDLDQHLAREGQYKDRRSGQIAEVREANLAVFDNEHRVKATDWLFRRGTVQNPNLPNAEPRMEQVLAQDFASDADVIEGLLEARHQPVNAAPSRNAIAGAVDWLTPDSLRGVELSLEAEAMAATVLERVMQGKAEIPTGGEVRENWTSTKRWGRGMLDKIAVQAESLRHYGKEYVDLDEFEQRSVDLWDSATRGVMESPFWGQMEKVDRFGDFMDYLGEEVPTWMESE